MLGCTLPDVADGDITGASLVRGETRAIFLANSLVLTPMTPMSGEYDTSQRFVCTVTRT